jgi:hypothetical protein
MMNAYAELLSCRYAELVLLCMYVCCTSNAPLHCLHTITSEWANRRWGINDLLTEN